MQTNEELFSYMNDGEKYSQIINDILDKFCNLNSDSIIDRILDSKEEYETICQTIRSILRWKRLGYIIAFHKELIATFLVGTAKYYYNDGEGGFWNQVENIIPQIKAYSRSDIVTAFYQVIQKYNLPDFEEERTEGYKLIAPIICHAGIPINCLDSWFDAIYQMRNVKYIYIESELNFACRYADKPVKRYVNFLSGRGILADEVQQLQELINCVILDKEIPEVLEFSYEVKLAAFKWAQQKKASKNYRFERYAVPELIFDSESYGLTVRLPKMKLKEESWILWEIDVDGELYRKKAYGKETANGYFYSDYDILIQPATTIKGKLTDENGNLLADFILKSEKDYLVFNNNGKQNKSKYLAKTPSYFICDNGASVCDNLQVAFEYKDFIAYVNDPDTDKEVWISNGFEVSTFYVKEKPELTDGRLLFDGNVDFEDVDVYSDMPQLTVPFDGKWEITLTDGGNRRVDCVRYADGEISIDNLIREEFGALEYGIYRLRVKHDKSGYSSFKFIYLPHCTIRKTGFFPGDSGYEIAIIKFECADDISVIDLNNANIQQIEIPVSDNVFEGHICYNGLYIPFHIHLKAFTWEIFNEEKSFGVDNKKSNISLNDLRNSEWVMLNIHNHTDKTYSIEINCGENYERIYYMGPNRKFSFNLKELTESVDASKEPYSSISIKVSDNKKFTVCSIKKQLNITGLVGKQIEDNKVLFCWDEDGALIDRELAVSNLILPHKTDGYPISDGNKYTAVDQNAFDEKQSYMIFIRQIETGYSSIYGDFEDKKRIFNVPKMYIRRKVLLNLTNGDFESVIKQDDPNLDQMIYSYLFLLHNPYGKGFDAIWKKILDVYRERIIEYRARFGDLKLYQSLFKYDLDEKVWRYILKNLALTMPCFTSDQLLSLQDAEQLKKGNLIAYIDYLYATKQKEKISEMADFVEKLNDKEAFILAKADLIFPKYTYDKEIFSSVQEWKRVQVKGKWVTETEALVHTMVDIILDKTNQRLNRATEAYASAVHNLYTKYQRTLLQMFMRSLEKQRR